MYKTPRGVWGNEGEYPASKIEVVVNDGKIWVTVDGFNCLTARAPKIQVRDERDPEGYAFSYTEEQKDEMLSRYRKGESQAHIASTLGVTTAAARYQILKHWRKHPDYAKKPIRE